jgi:1-phosphofructokinase family hexose kinase
MAANPSIDRLFEIDRLRPGAVHRPESFVQVAGGKGVNVARAAAALGAEVQVLAILAGHAGRWLAQELAAAGIPLDVVWVDGETRSSLSVADRAGAGLTEFYERGPQVSPSAWAELAELAAGHAGADWLTVSGSLPPGASTAGYRGLDPGCPLALDSTEMPPQRVDLIKVNAAEAARLTGIDTTSAGGAQAAARELARGAAAAAVTRGAAGAVLVAPDGSALAGTLDAAGRYPVGSGDAFLAGLVVARAGGAGWADAMRFALGAAAANAVVPGAGRLERDVAERLAGRAAVSSI